tara:strand:- start:261 stop:695 length:435 start_codon:yes stop_codon:yes gene_type:complete
VVAETILCETAMHLSGNVYDRKIQMDVSQPESDTKMLIGENSFPSPTILKNRSPEVPKETYIIDTDKLEITEILDFYVQGFKMKPDPWKLIIVTDEKDRVTYDVITKNTDNDQINRFFLNKTNNTFKSIVNTRNITMISMGRCL